MRKTLGGDRLGAGKKQEVELHNYGRSTHDKGYLWRSTMAAGTLVPFMTEIALPGDTFDINLDCDVKTHPTVGPLFGSFKVQLDIFLAPIRLYQGALHNNKLGIGLQMAQIKLPVYALKSKGLDTQPIDTGVDNSQINPSSIFAYLGVRGVGIVPGAGVVTREFQALYWLAYWDAYKNYYANKQEEIGAVLHTTPANKVETVTEVLINGNNVDSGPVIVTGVVDIKITFAGTTQPLNQVILRTTTGEINAAELGGLTDINSTFYVISYDWAKWGNRNFTGWRYVGEFEMLPAGVNVQTFPLSEIDDMREAILTATSVATPFSVNDAALSPWNFALDESAEWYAWQQPQEGLALKTYQSDLFNNWLQTEWIDGPNGINEITKVDTTSGGFTMDALLVARKVYDMLNRIAVSGGSYDDWMDAVWTHDRYTRCETPMYMGGLIKELVFQEVVSNSESGAENQGAQALGTLAGKGVLAKKHKGGNVTIKVDEPSVIIANVSLTPRIDYSQGNDWSVHLKTMDDLHKPGLDEIGFQELITEQMAWWDTSLQGGLWVQKSAGKQPAWLNYMTNVNRNYGNFAIEDNEMFMTLNRKYVPVFEDDVYRIDDLTTYIDPMKYNSIFAQTSRDAMNFWVQIAVDMTARRKMSARVMPNL